MGSGNSRLGCPQPSPPRRPKVNRTKQRLASFICGGASSSSHSSLREDCAAESLVNSAEFCQQIDDKSPNESFPTSNGGTGFTSWSSPRSEPGASSDSSTICSEHVPIEDNSPIVESSSKRKCYSERDEVVPTHHSNPNRPTISEIDELVRNDVPQTCPDVISPSSLEHEELEGLPTLFEESNEVAGNHSSDYSAARIISNPSIVSRSHGHQAIQEGMPSGLGILVSDRVQARPDGSVLHVDVVSISSNIMPNVNNEISTREARRNSRRMFWDAFSSRNSRRHADIPALLFTSEDADPMGSRRRWLLDIGDDFFDDGVGGDSWRSGRRSRITNESRRAASRSEMFWERMRGAARESSHRATCPFDLHPDGSCSCRLDEEASALSSISRIVLLAEALFEVHSVKFYGSASLWQRGAHRNIDGIEEDNGLNASDHCISFEKSVLKVLDEIHRQPESFSLSMLSVPAPESVVDSLPLKIFEKPNTANNGDDVDQCYICLVEYEQGDKIRVLPCHHEYHMSCVDKWLKEIHGVCPLCRGDVRGGGVREGAASSSDAQVA